MFIRTKSVRRLGAMTLPIVLCCCMTVAHAQAPRRPTGPTGVLSMPPDTIMGERRKVTLTQVTQGGETIGTPLELDCPRTGCGMPLTLTVEENIWQFFANLSFVERGMYLTLEPRSIGISAVVDFTAGRAGPTFMSFRGQKAVTGQARFVIARDASVREQERESDPKFTSNGPVYARKREPDVLLQIEIGAPTQGAKPK